MSDDFLAMMELHHLPKSGIIHVGANYAGEARFYDKYGQVPVAFVEAVPSIYELAVQTTSKYPMQRVFNACCSEVDGQEVTFNVSSNRGMSSSMFPLGRHGVIIPGVSYVEKFTTKTTRLDTLLSPHYRPDEFNLGVIDTQGADLMVLKGFGRFLDHLEALFIEISDEPLYEGGATFDEIYRYMGERGFIPAFLKLHDTNWGNAFFKRREPVYLREARTAVSIGKPTTMSSLHAQNFSSLGNDGDLSVRRKFFHTKNEAQPWWMVDLEEVMAIRKILLFDRLEQQDRAETLYCAVSQDGEKWERIYTRQGEPGTQYKSPISLEYRGRVRYVKVGLDGTNWFHLRQVAVIKDEVEDVSVQADGSSGAASE